MAIKSYILLANVDAPCVVATGIPHKPQQIKMKRFFKNEIVRGELKHADNKPAFVLVNGVFVVPINAVKEVFAKDITSNASGSSEPSEKPKIKVPPANKLKLIDGAIFGAIAGVGAVILAEKQGWLAEVDKKNKIYGALIGAGAGIYLMYRYKAFAADKAKDKE